MLMPGDSGAEFCRGEDCQDWPETWPWTGSRAERVREAHSEAGCSSCGAVREDIGLGIETKRSLII